jgi:sugar lactone lactonase YvrE
MITLTPKRVPFITDTIITQIASTNRFVVSWSINYSWCFFDIFKVTVELYSSTSQDTISGTSVGIIQTTGNSCEFTVSQSELYYYAIVSGENSNSVVTNIIIYGNIINTIAGTGTSAGGVVQDGIPAIYETLSFPESISVSSGNIYIADNHRIRKIDAAGIITTVAGDSTTGYGGDNGPAVFAQLNAPAGVYVTTGGEIYIADVSNQCIRKVDAAGIITTVTGTGLSPGYSGDGGLAIIAQLNIPHGVYVTTGGEIYIADSGNHRIRKVTAGNITTVAGDGTAEYSGDGGSAVSASLNVPLGVHVTTGGEIYIADSGNHCIRKVDADGDITTVAGTGGSMGYSGDGGPAIDAQLNLPKDVTTDSAGNIYIADMDNHRIRKVTISTGIITTVAGDGNARYSGDGELAFYSSLNVPAGVSLDSGGNIYIADSTNCCIRKVTVLN